MDILLSLLLQLQKAQLTLNTMQPARVSRVDIRQTRPSTVQAVAPVAAPAPIPTSTPKPAPQQSVTPVQPTPTQNADVRTQIEQYVLEATNAARAQHGLSPLTADAQAAAVARAHSQDMLAKNYFEHTNLSGCNAGCRLTNAGYAWRSYGENIHWMSGYKLSAQDSAKKIVNDWMNSPGHRANILGAFKYAGVGIAVSGDKIYSTTDYTTK